MIVAVNGRTLQGLAEEVAVSLVKGPPGTNVKLTMQATAPAHGGHRGSPPALHTETLTRATISEPVVASLTRTVNGVKLGVVALAAFTEGAHGEVREAVEHELHLGARGIVLDLRGNGGGLVVEAQLIASIFIPCGDDRHHAWAHAADEPP